jgi:putative CocE/NonD family hydrolase
MALPRLAAAALLLSLALPSISSALPNPIQPDPLYPTLHSPALTQYVTMDDGAAIFTETYLPAGPGPWPSILVDTPYHMDYLDEPRSGTSTINSDVNLYRGAGYSYTFADVRGTGYSGGCFGMMDSRERKDAAALVEWVAAQPWSNGKVGMKGQSYEGSTPHEAATLSPAHLLAIATSAGVTSLWLDVYHNGVPAFDNQYPVTYLYADDAPPSPDVFSTNEWLGATTTNLCGEPQAMAQFLPDYRGGVYNGYWAERDILPLASSITTPILYQQGFTDPRVFPSSAIHWFNDIPAPKRAIFHQGGHVGLDSTTEKEWFDYWLKGVQNGALSPTVQVTTNLGTTRTDTVWPPANVTLARSYLAPAQLVATAPAAGSETYTTDTFPPSLPPGTGADQTNTVLATGHRILATEAGAAGVPIQLSYQGATLAAPLRLAGQPQMHLEAASSAPLTDFLCTLYDVTPSTGAWAPVSVGWFNAQLREGFDHAVPLEPGTTYGFNWSFEPREYVFQAGHAVGLRIAGSDPNALPETPATNTVHYGPAGSFLDLPTI